MTGKVDKQYGGDTCLKQVMVAKVKVID